MYYLWILKGCRITILDNIYIEYIYIVYFDIYIYNYSIVYFDIYNIVFFYVWMFGMLVNFALRFDTSQRVIAKQWERDWWDPVGPCGTLGWCCCCNILKLLRIICLII